MCVGVDFKAIIGREITIRKSAAYKSKCVLNNKIGDAAHRHTWPLAHASSWVWMDRIPKILHFYYKKFPIDWILINRRLDYNFLILNCSRFSISMQSIFCTRQVIVRVHWAWNNNLIWKSVWIRLALSRIFSGKVGVSVIFTHWIRTCDRNRRLFQSLNVRKGGLLVVSVFALK